MGMTPIICLMGPTASGKTGLSLELAEQIGGEIVSVDSALIYRGMDIGTAKPTPAEQQRAPHWLMDIRDPADSYSVADFCRDAKQHIESIQQRGHIPMLVGGTMMYFNALINGISAIPEADAAIREQIQQEAAAHGWSKMHASLAAVDPIVAQRVHPNDPQRIGRALEVFHSSGKPLSYWQQQKTPGLKDDQAQVVHQFAIAPTDRKVLHQRIQQRFDEMLLMGFIEEVEALRQRGDLHLDMPSMRCVGYRQVWQYLDGEFSYADMVEKGVAATRQLAKRQHTWLRGWDELHWLNTFATDNSAVITKMVTK
ncbi:tRNA (adenosine(37)-N6)-dimethylallyltransferase MiaA [Alteromonas flava]|uniref:tRNA (adenosine(37)-N6)-dimethylallyltransferase MiaA n=1 Tax=Alteromonas flava TaxID=2048003 RepID=UPI000C28B217|nr:tRNA (adenosine(37)-N6)-dimethylallyltransferase MiaA [Alteromonas flava]